MGLGVSKALNKTNYFKRQREMLTGRLDRAMARHDLEEVARIDAQLRKFEKDKKP